MTFYQILEWYISIDYLILWHNFIDTPHNFGLNKNIKLLLNKSDTIMVGYKYGKVTIKIIL